MRIRAAWIVAIALVLVAPRPLRAGEEGRAVDDGPLAGLSGARALEYAKELAAPGMKGRKTGFEGGRLIEEYLQSKLGELGLTPHQAEAVLALSREVVERIVWEVVPQLAEAIIKEEIARLTKE